MSGVNRIIELDFFRGIILFYMVFVNAYYVMAQNQLPGLTHDASVMYPGDLIIVFFCLSVGFNLGLVQNFKNYDKTVLLSYGVKRGFFLILIGILLISYSLFFYRFDLTVFFRSFLVLLGLIMIFTTVFIALFENYLGYWPYFGLAATGFLFLPAPEENFRFLTPGFFLSSLWGYIAARWYLQRPEIFLKRARQLCLLFLFLGILYGVVHEEFPSRLKVNFSYITVSWGILLFLFTLVLSPRFAKIQKGKIFTFIAHSGRFPLSFWIIQSFTIVIVLFLLTLYKYYKDNMLAYLSQMPLMIRTVQNNVSAVFFSFLSATVAWVSHRGFIKLYLKKQN